MTAASAKQQIFAPWDMERIRQLELEISEVPSIRPDVRKKVTSYLVEQEIWHISDIDYEFRKMYEGYVAQHIPKATRHLYITALDRLKQHAIQKSMKTFPGRVACQWQYEDRIFFIPYHPDETVEKAFDSVRGNPNMVWDFSVSCSRHLKQQIFLVLNSILKMDQPSRLREYRLTGLQYLFQFCAERNVDDLEKLEQNQIAEFGKFLSENIANTQKVQKISGILDYSRKQIFLSGKMIHWNANVWYLERFHFPEEKLNLSGPIKTISFLDVTQKENREVLQAYMKYELGVSEDAVSVAEDRFYHIRDFLVALEKLNCSVLDCTEEQMELYLKELQEKEISAKTFNIYISRLVHFYSFLAAHGYPVRIPFEPAYYTKKEVPIHHDRSVPEQISQEILEKLGNFPEHLRIMFLHVWGTGLRISEVCSLKGKSYYRQGKDGWIQVYQIKMKCYKRIPIPDALYQIVMVYRKRHGIGPEDFLFQNQDGGAFSYSTFMDQMKKCCEENQIQNGMYLFRSHDYRHTIATLFYDEHVSVQAIRDYLGHENEEMTKQYLDYMPRKMAKANDAFFHKKGNSLLSVSRERRGHGT